jgi:DNA-binding GntR family transcriptional regulator
LRTLTDYTPVRSSASIEAIEASYERMREAQEKETQIKAEARTALEAARAAEWEFHNCILEAKAAVIAQYGADSPQLRTVGLKRKSAYKRPARQVKPAEAV